MRVNSSLPRPRSRLSWVSFSLLFLFAFLYRTKGEDELQPAASDEEVPVFESEEERTAYWAEIHR